MILLCQLFAATDGNDSRISPQHGGNVKDFADEDEDFSDEEDYEEDDKFPRIT